MIPSPRNIAASLALSAIMTLSASQLSASPLPAQEPPPLASAPDDTTRLASIAGTVVSAGTDQPLRKAQVSLTYPDHKINNTRTAVTGADGKFAFEGIAPGEYYIYVARDGFVPISYGADSSGQGSAILTLVAGQKIKDLLFRLQKTAVISGRVTDEDGDPVQGVSVDAVMRVTYRGKTSIAGTNGQTKTNDLGEYRLFDLQPGKYYVRATPNLSERFEAHSVSLQPSPSDSKPPNNYVQTYYPNAVDPSRASPIELKAGDEVSSMDFSLLRVRTYKIRGQVIDSTGNNDAQRYSVTVLSTDALSSQSVAQQMAEKNNSFEVTGLPPGKYVLVATGFGDRRVSRGFDNVEIIDSDLDSLRLFIKRGSEVRGRVAIEGLPSTPNHLRILLIVKDSDFGMGGGSAFVKPDGTFEVPDVLDGSFAAFVQSDCEECYLKSARMNGIDLLEKGLQVAGGTPQPLELVYSSRSATIDGVVTKDDDLPAVGATIIIVPDPPYRELSRRDKSATTDQYGRFTIRGVAPGGYKAFALRNVGNFDLTDPEFTAPLESKGERISIDENGKQSLHLKLITADPSNPSK